MGNPSINLILKKDLSVCPNCSSVDFWPREVSLPKPGDQSIQVSFGCKYCGLESLLEFQFSHVTWFNADHDDVDLAL